MITAKQLENLKAAVSNAEDWRGSLVGCAPDYALDAFDDYIANARAGLEAIEGMRAEIKQLRSKVNHLRHQLMEKPE